MISIAECGKYSIVNTREKYVEINGCKYPFPRRMKGRTVSQVNGKIYIDGYEFKNGKFKKTLKALYYKWF